MNNTRNTNSDDCEFSLLDTIAGSVMLTIGFAAVCTFAIVVTTGVLGG